MAISFVQANGAYGSNTGSVNVVLPAAPTDGHLLVAFIYCQGTQAPTMPAGWTALTLASGGSGKSVQAGQLFYKIASGDSATIVCSLGGTNNFSAIVAEYSGIDTTTPLLVESSALNASGTNTTPSVTPTTGKNALAVCAAGVKTTTTFSSETVGGVAATERSEVATGTPSAALWDLTIASTSGSYSGAFTPASAAVDVGAIAIFQAGASGPQTFTKTLTTSGTSSVSLPRQALRAVTASASSTAVLQPAAFKLRSLTASVSALAVLASTKVHSSLLAATASVLTVLARAVLLARSVATTSAPSLFRRPAKTSSSASSATVAVARASFSTKNVSVSSSSVLQEIKAKLVTLSGLAASSAIVSRLVGLFRGDSATSGVSLGRLVGVSKAASVASNPSLSRLAQRLLSAGVSSIVTVSGIPGSGGGSTYGVATYGVSTYGASGGGSTTLKALASSVSTTLTSGFPIILGSSGGPVLIRFVERVFASPVSSTAAITRYIQAARASMAVSVSTLSAAKLSGTVGQTLTGAVSALPSIAKVAFRVLGTSASATAGVVASAIRSTVNKTLTSAVSTTVGLSKIVGFNRLPLVSVLSFFARAISVEKMDSSSALAALDAHTPTVRTFSASTAVVAQPVMWFLRGLKIVPAVFGSLAASAASILGFGSASPSSSTSVSITTADDPSVTITPAGTTDMTIQVDE